MATSKIQKQFTDIVSAERVMVTATTGSTGNIALGYANDGLTAIVAPHVSGGTAYLRAWISTINGGWYLTAVDPNTGATINNTKIAIRFWVFKFSHS